MSKRTAKHAKARVALLVSFLGAKDFRELTESDARNFCAAKLEGYAGSTLAGALSILRCALNVAVMDRLIKEHPIPTLHRVMSDVKDKGRKEIKSRDAWTWGESDRMIAMAGKKSRALGHALFVLFQTGTRRGEMLTLQWSDVDFARGRLWIRRTTELGLLLLGMVALAARRSWARSLRTS